MNIAIITQTFPLTPKDSTAHFMYDFARGLAQVGCTVFVLVPFHPSLAPHLFSGIRVVPFRYITPDRLHLLGFGRTMRNDQSVPWFVYFLTPLYLLFGTLALRKLVRENHIDVINAHWLVPNGLCAAVVSRLTGVPFVVTLPGTDVYLAQTNMLARLISRVAITNAREIVSNSPQLLRDLNARGRVISYGVPTNTGKRKKHTGVVVATAGRTVPKKGFEMLRRIYPDIEIITSLPIDQFRKKLLAVDIFVAPSIRDAKGNLDDASLVVLEAMAAGCAVVVSDLPGYRRIITDGYNGILIKPYRASEMKQSLQTLKRSKHLRDRLGNAARRAINDRFTPEIITRKYLSVFQEAI